MILDSERYRFQRLISDIAGQDIRSHGNTTDGMISAVRKWLNAHAKGNGIPGTASIQRYFKAFAVEVVCNLEVGGLTEDDLTYTTWSDYMMHWLAVRSSKAKPVCPACGK